MMKNRVCIVTPAAASSRTGNRHTAARYAAFLRAYGRRVRIVVEWDGAPCEAMIALHARRSRSSIVAYREKYPNGPLVVVLTGTDIYRDIRHDSEARDSLALADRLVVLQKSALDELTDVERAKASVVYQSSATRLRHMPIVRRFRIAVLGHLRDEKDPFCALRALEHIQDAAIEVLHVGSALSPDVRATAENAMRKEPRYRWIGGRPHGEALRRLAASHVLVVSSKMEGGANVICEAGRIGVPVLASNIPGNVGMLGAGYPGYYPLEDDRALAALIERARTDLKFYRSLVAHIKQRAPLFAPHSESRGVRNALRQAADVAGGGKRIV